MDSNTYNPNKYNSVIGCLETTSAAIASHIALKAQTTHEISNEMYEKLSGICNSTFLKAQMYLQDLDGNKYNEHFALIYADITLHGFGLGDECLLSAIKRCGDLIKALEQANTLPSDASPPVLLFTPVVRTTVSYTESMLEDQDEDQEEDISPALINRPFN